MHICFLIAQYDDDDDDDDDDDGGGGHDNRLISHDPVRVCQTEPWSFLIIQ